MSLVAVLRDLNLGTALNVRATPAARIVLIVDNDPIGLTENN